MKVLTNATTYTVNISSSQTLTRIELIGAGGGDGGTDSGQGNSTTTGPAGRYIVDIELTNTTIKVAPGRGGNDGGDTVSGSALEREYENIPSGGVNSLNSNFNGGDGGQAGFSGTSGQGGSGGAASIVEIGSGSGDYIVAGGAGGGGGAGKSSPFSNTSGTGTYSANGSSTTGADGLQAVEKAITGDCGYPVVMVDMLRTWLTEVALEVVVVDIMEVLQVL